MTMTADAPDATVRSGSGWLTTQRVGAGLAAVVAIANQAVAGGVIPPLLVFAILFLVGIGLSTAKPKAGSIMLGIVAILFLLGSVPFLSDDLGHPEGAYGFIAGAASVVGGLLCIAGFVATLMKRDGGARAALIAGGALMVVAVIVAGLSASGAESDERSEGDVAVRAANIEFDPGTVTVKAGDEIGVHVDNADLVRHTFTVDELDLEIDVPPGKQRRATFSAEAGSYEFHCAVPGHETMKGELVVEG